ncbi:unnamed protein product [Discosporangium mesarthrocarpum]
MPRPPGYTMLVKQDSAKSHTGKGVMEAIQDAAGDIILETPPANSPYLNVNDLGFFHFIQQLKKNVGMNNAEEVEATVEAFDERH